MWRRSRVPEHVPSTSAAARQTGAVGTGGFWFSRKPSDVDACSIALARARFHWLWSPSAPTATDATTCVGRCLTVSPRVRENVRLCQSVCSWITLAVGLIIVGYFAFIVIPVCHNKLQRLDITCADGRTYHTHLSFLYGRPKKTGITWPETCAQLVAGPVCGTHLHNQSRVMARATQRAPRAAITSWSHSDELMTDVFEEVDVLLGPAQPWLGNNMPASATPPPSTVTPAAAAAAADAAAAAAATTTPSSRTTNTNSTATSTNTRPMRIAYLLLMHGHASDVLRLIERVYQPYHVFLIHVDSTATNRAAILNALRAGVMRHPEWARNVWLTRRAFGCAWGGISLVYAEMTGYAELVLMARGHRPAYSAAGDQPLHPSQYGSAPPAAAAANTNSFASSPPSSSFDFNAAAASTPTPSSSRQSVLSQAVSPPPQSPSPDPAQLQQQQQQPHAAAAAAAAPLTSPPNAASYAQSYFAHSRAFRQLIPAIPTQTTPPSIPPASASTSSNTTPLPPGDGPYEKLEWDYVINLSESDWPLRSKEELDAELRALNGASLAGYYRQAHDTYLRVTGYHVECEGRVYEVLGLDDWRRSMLTGSRAATTLGAWQGRDPSIRWSSSGRYMGEVLGMELWAGDDLSWPSFVDQGFFHKGSQWHVLSNALVDVLVRARRVREWLFFFKNTFIPDEHFMASMVTALGSITDQRIISREVHYKKWDTAPLTCAEVQQLRCSSYWFARKFADADDLTTDPTIAGARICADEAAARPCEKYTPVVAPKSWSLLDIARGFRYQFALFRGA